MEPVKSATPPAPMKFYMPFYYSSLETCWTFFSTSADAVKPLLAGKVRHGPQEQNTQIVMLG